MKTMSKKLTVVEQYANIIAKCNGVLTESELAFLQERSDLHAKKNANRKPTKAQTENEAVKEKILEFMQKGKVYTIAEIQKGVGLDSNQKTSALVRQLRDNDLVIRSEVKGKAYFTLA